MSYNSYCPNCETQVSETAVVCRGCGAYRTLEFGLFVTLLLPAIAILAVILGAAAGFAFFDERVGVIVFLALMGVAFLIRSKAKTHIVWNRRM